MKRGERSGLAGRELGLVSRLDSGLSAGPGEGRDWVCPLTGSHPDHVLFTNNNITDHWTPDLHWLPATLSTA